LPTANPSTERNIRDRPERDVRPEYPNLQQITYPGGQRITIDSTKGYERIRIEHPSGTYWEVYANGDKTDFVVGNAQQTHKSGLTISVNTNGDIAIGGQARFLVGGGAHIEVTGDAGVVVGQDALVVAGGDLKASVDNAYLGTRGDLNINVAKNTNIRTAGNLTLETRGDVTMKTEGNMSQLTDGDTMMAAKGNMTTEAGAAHHSKGATIDHNGPGAPSPNYGSSIPTV
jgi:hypothetical protein